MLPAFLKRKVIEVKSAPAETCTLAEVELNNLKVVDRRLDFAEFVTPTDDPSIILLDSEVGHIVSYGLYRSEGEISVARTTFTKGSHFPNHTHDQCEVFVIYKGYLEVTVEGKRVDKKGRRIYYVMPGQKHEVTATEDTKVIVITIPHSEEFPIPRS